MEIKKMGGYGVWKAYTWSDKILRNKNINTFDIFWKKKIIQNNIYF